MDKNVQSQIDLLCASEDGKKTFNAVRQRALSFFRDEKACHTDPVTGVVDPTFPAYPQWLGPFWKDFFANRQLGASLEEIEAISDAEIEQAETELEALAAGTLVPESTDVKPAVVYTTMRGEKTTKPPLGKKVISKIVKNFVKAKKAKLAGKTKAEIGRGIVAKMIEKGKARKDIIVALVAKANMTQAGASTFYQSVK